MSTMMIDFRKGTGADTRGLKRQRSQIDRVRSEQLAGSVRPISPNTIRYCLRKSTPRGVVFSPCSIKVEPTRGAENNIASLSRARTDVDVLSSSSSSSCRTDRRFSLRHSAFQLARSRCSHPNNFLYTDTPTQERMLITRGDNFNFI